MSEHINLVQRRRAQLQEAVGDLGQLVIDALHASVQCLAEQDTGNAARIISDDLRINAQRRVLEQECLVALAAYKPAGADLRAIGACMELASELERIGDYAADIARIILRAGEARFPREPVEAIIAVATDAIAMLTESLAAFTASEDEQHARDSIAREEQVDDNERAVIEQVLAMMRADPDFATLGTYLLWIVHNYERVADRATNVAERTVYVASGEMLELG
ncbi:phosphate transport system regulatory protein PhoU [Thiocapsa imhoffii]|uniref:Phosphate-specific transport system accessory protein PhoU n=1 Tax=Thiocapsa imhoffii TaxID=382777 RepID=A0A9X0WEA0_9GAMM|nr:phosphate signaling complex protein PhoU [Thiocapsa imhoffii]MBK1643109.1 phosphate transport system regulatory protein PhoU [Thiocapsa imhoffii]